MPSSSCRGARRSRATSLSGWTRRHRHATGTRTSCRAEPAAARSSAGSGPTSAVAARRPDRRRDRRGADRPQEPRLRRHRRDPVAERPLRRRRGRAPVRGLRHLPADLDGAELGPGRRRGERRGGGRHHRRGRHRVVRRRADARVRAALPRPRRPQDGLDRAVPVPGGGDRVPVRRGDRRRHRRAAQDQRHGRVAARTRSRSCARGSARSATATGPRSSSARSRSSSCSGCASSRRACPAPWCSSSAACSPRTSFDLGDHGVALVGDVPRGLPSFALPDLGLMWDHVVPVTLGAFALMLIGFSQTAGDARAFAAKHRLPDRRQPGVARAVRREHRLRACSRACPSRRACRRARSTTTPAPARASRRSRPASRSCRRCWSWRRCSPSCPSRCSAR